MWLERYGVFNLYFFLYNKKNVLTSPGLIENLILLNIFKNVYNAGIFVDVFYVWVFSLGMYYIIWILVNVLKISILFFY